MTKPTSLPSLTLTTRSADRVRVDALVLAVASSPQGPMLLGELPAALHDLVAGLREPLGIGAAADSLTRLPGAGAAAAPLVLLTGVGPAAEVTPETLRRAAGAALRTLSAMPGIGSAALALPAAALTEVAAVAEGALLGSYAFSSYRSKPSRQALATLSLITPLARDRHAKQAVERAAVIAEAVAATRDLVNTPPSDLYPASFAEAARSAVTGLPISIAVLDERRLARGGYGGLLGVGQGSARPPRLVRLDYAPAGARHHLALVGKGITFDSGGLSIKPAAGMETMKGDMAGAATVLHTVIAAARLGLPVRLTGWLALAENLPSGTAMRPSDVIRIRGGRTVEVLNTDAEGRLVLADAMTAASETKPDLMVDIATLTGAQRVALGNRIGAIMANRAELRERVHRLSEVAGEQFWPMPLPPELRASLDSTVADIANMGDRFGGMMVAGLFLAEFVPGDLPWAHLDIAAPSFNGSSPYGYVGKGGTGMGLRTLLGLAEDVATTGA